MCGCLCVSVCRFMRVVLRVGVCVCCVVVCVGCVWLVDCVCVIVGLM